MDDKLKKQLNEIKQLKGEERERELLAFAEKNNSPQAYNELGVYYKDKITDYEKAVEMFQKALSIQEDATVYSNLATSYYNLCKKSGPLQKDYMKKTVEAFEASARINSASYFFLGNLYLPKSNPPFPDDAEKANSYYMKIEKDKKYFWANGMKAIASYYKTKEDYITASAFMYLAKNADPTDKKMANYYEICFGKVNRRKFWEAQFQKIQDQNDVKRIIEEGKKTFIIRCPRCGSEKCRKLNVLEYTKKFLQVSFGVKRLEKYSKHYRCMSCNFEW